MENKKTFLYVISGGALVSLAVSGLYYFWKRLSKPKLSAWVEEYMNEIEVMLKERKDGHISVEAIGHIFQVITEVEENLYVHQNADLEEERVDAIGRDQQYRLLFAETMETRNEYYEKATKYVEDRLKISIGELDEVLKKFSPKETKDILKKAKKKYTDVPEVKQSAVREAFIYFVKQKKLNEKFSQEQIYIMNLNPEHRNRAMANIYFIKNKLKDEIKAKFGFDEKYLDQLVEKHDLLKDSEVLYYHEELKSLE